MITNEEIQKLAKKYKINQTIIFREYLQLWFLSQLYTTKGSEEVFFKGGTAIHLLLKSFRFSEDLDFTVQHKESDFERLSKETLRKTLQFEGLSVKPKKTLTGKSFLLTYNGALLDFKTFISLDFSFREKVLNPARSPLTTDFPLVFTGFIHHLSFEEILAEKIRAIITRKKGRDLFDLWFLLSKNVHLNRLLIEKKMAYYPKISWSRNLLVKTISDFSGKEFEMDLKPFLPLEERARISEIFELAKHTCLENIRESFG